MTYTELQTHITSYFLRRTDVSALVPVAIQRAHHQVQMDGEWRCCEAHDTLSFTSTSSDGVAVPADYRSAVGLFLLDDDGNTVGEIQSATEAQVKKFKIEKYQDNTITTTAAFHNRWWEEELKINLLFLPATGETISTRLEYFKRLPDYSDSVTSDHFSVYYWPLLVECALWLGSTSLWEDDRAADFERRYRLELAKAQAQDKKFKAGGTAGVYRPPLPGTGRR